MLRAYADRYRHDLVERVIPFWLAHSLDRQHGGYFTCLDRTGAVYDSRKYVWLQGRAVWTFSRLYNEWEPRQEFLDAATLGATFLRRHARDAQGRVFFSLSREGMPAAFQRKPYAAVFYQMGMFEYARASGDQSFLDESVEVFWKILEWIRQPALLDRPRFPAQVAASNLADLLTVGLMALDLARQFNDPRYHEVVRETIAGILRHYDRERRLFVEQVANNSDKHSLPEGRLFNPGHSIETAWILLHLLELFPDATHQQIALEALEGSLERGWDSEYGGIFYFMDLENKPTLQLESTMKLWWPHAEAIYALVLAWTQTHDPRWITWLERVDRYTYSHFVDHQHGEWFGYCDRQGNLALESKGGNYKGFFHVPRALLFSVQAIERDQIQQETA